MAAQAAASPPARLVSDRPRNTHRDPLARYVAGWASLATVRLDHPCAQGEERLHRARRAAPRAVVAVPVQELLGRRSGRVSGDLRTAAAPGKIPSPRVRR